MKRHVLMIPAVAVALVVQSATSQAQLPGPGPEHDKLKEMVGSWDCEITMPGVPPSKGTSTFKMTLGGMWLESTFEGEFAGQKFSGRGLDSFDAMSGKYQSVWVDSMTGFPTVFTGNYDDSGKVMTMTADSIGEGGEPAKLKSVSTNVDEDHHKFTMYMVAGDTDVEVMTINYTRRK